MNNIEINGNTSSETLDKLSNDENFKDENIEKKMNSVEVNNFTVETAESIQNIQQQEQAQQNVEAQELLEQQNKEHVATL